jgi:DNA-directed RNA polymerase specialized sigma24 family protein
MNELPPRVLPEHVPRMYRVALRLLGCADEAHEVVHEACVKALPDDCRTAFVLTQLEGYSYDEAAAIAGEPRGTIASRVLSCPKDSR